MDKILKKFSDTYDTRHLDKLSKEDQYFIHEIAKEFVDKKGNNTMMNLIINHYEQPSKKPVTKYLEGPLYISLLQDIKSGKQIYIFGENHDGMLAPCNEKDKPIKILPYLKQLFQNTDVFIDFFFESFSERDVPDWDQFKDDYTSEEVKKHGYLNILRNYFERCIRYETRHRKECRLTRVHFNDPRHMKSYITDMESLHNTLKEYSTFFNFVQKKEKIKEVCNTIVEKHKDVLALFPLTKNNYIKMYEKIMNDNPYLHKELAKVPEDIRQTLINLTLDVDWSEDVAKYIGQINNAIRNLKAGKATKTDIGHIATGEVIINTAILDLYNIARIFKPIVHKRPSKEEEYPQPEEMSNIVIYAGFKHSINISKILQRFGFKMTKKKLEMNMKAPKTIGCLDMKSINQPFFNKDFN